MENTVKTGLRVKNSTFYKSQAGIILIIALIFAYFYLLNRNPLVDVKIPVGPPVAPAFSHFIYGGFGNDQLWKPMGVTSIGDRVFVADTNHYRIQSFTKDGTPIKIFGSRGDKSGQFQFPYGLTGDSQGRLLVADMYLGKISIFDIDGNYVGEFGQGGDVEKHIEAPSDITFVEGKLYVADVKKDRVYVFDENGKLLLEVGKEFNELSSPNGVTVDKKTGEIYVVDTRNARIVVYDKEGKALGQFDGSTEEKKGTTLSNPRGIDIDAKGVIYIVNNLSHMVFGFSAEYQKLFEFGGMGDGQEQFVLPNGIHIDEDNFVYITDTTNNRVAVYR